MTADPMPRVLGVVVVFLVVCVIVPAVGRAVVLAAASGAVLADLWALAKHVAAHPPMTDHLRDGACRLLNGRTEG